MRRHKEELGRFARIVLALTLVCCLVRPASIAAQSTPPGQPSPTPCPEFLPSETQCFTGKSGAGAPFFIAMPKDWNQNLILFAHGGPRLGTPKLAETIEDLERFEVMVREGFAWAGTTYRRGGYGVRSAAEDTDQLRTLTWQHFGRPKRTILHGQSWGGNVAAKAAELYAMDLEGKRNFDGVILTSGVLAGGTKAYWLRSDLRAVYQYYCRNHPRPNETHYPVWQGLPPGATMTRAELGERVRECTGIGTPVSQRTAKQKANLRNITSVLSIKEEQILPNLAWATNTFQDMIGRLNGRNPFSNQGVVYKGSDNDRALNAGVERFAADPTAVAELAYDSDLSGLIVAPVITVHGIHDPVAHVSHEAAYRRTIEQAGRGDLLVQSFTDEAEHSRLSVPTYPTLFSAMLNWIETGQKPSPATIKAACPVFAEKYKEPCLFVVPYTPALTGSRF
ncbi:MAG: alpha/beta hydrolase family protein [Hyphomonadaceae bacterium]